MLLIFCEKCDEVLRVHADDSTEEVERFVRRSGWVETAHGHACQRCSVARERDELSGRWLRAASGNVCLRELKRSTTTTGHRYGNEVGSS